MGAACQLAPAGQLPAKQPAEVDPELLSWWDQLSLSKKTWLLRVQRRALFERIRSQYCSRCHGLFALRYDELRSNDALECEACAQFYAGLKVAPDGSLTLEDHLAESQPFQTFAESKARERERELQAMCGLEMQDYQAAMQTAVSLHLQFMTGDICGNGFKRAPGLSSCSLHTARVPVEALTEYWGNLPEEHKETLFGLHDEDFVAELDAHMRYHLKICKDCRGNVMKAYKEVKASAKDQKGSKLKLLEVCSGHNLVVTERLVSLDGPASATFFERAEEVEECNAISGECGDSYDGTDRIRHAETPELAREALIDSVVLIFKSQVEVAFREQTAGHNALLLFVHLTLQIMEEQIMAAFRELRAKQAAGDRQAAVKLAQRMYEAVNELLETLESEQRQQVTKKAGKKKRRGAACKPALTGSPEEAAATEELLAMGKDMGGEGVPCKLPCCKCAALQGAGTCCSPRAGGKALGAQPATAVSESHSFIRGPERQSEEVVPEQKTASGGGDSPCSEEGPTAVAAPDTPAARLTQKASTGQQGRGAAEAPHVGQGEWEVQQRGRRTSTDRRAPAGGTPAGPKHSPAPPRAPGGPQLRSAASAVSGSHGPVPIGGAVRSSCAVSGPALPAAKSSWGSDAGSWVRPVPQRSGSGSSLGSTGEMLGSHPARHAGSLGSAGEVLGSHPARHTGSMSQGSAPVELRAMHLSGQPLPPPPCRPTHGLHRPGVAGGGATVGAPVGGWAKAPPPPPPSKAVQTPNSNTTRPPEDPFSLFSHQLEKTVTHRQQFDEEPLSSYQLFAPHSTYPLAPLMLPVAL